MSIQLPPMPDWKSQVNNQFQSNMMNLPDPYGLSGSTGYLNMVNSGGPSLLSSLGSSLLGGLPGLLGGIGSGLLSYFGQKSANEAMLEQTRLTNEANYRLYQEQKQHNVDMFNMENQANIDMWNMQNEYNDPSKQVERLRKAGLNPALMMGSNPSGVASSSPKGASVSPSSPTPNIAPPPQAFTSPGLVAGQQALASLLQISQSFATSQGMLASERNLPHQLLQSKHGATLVKQNAKNVELQNELQQQVMYDTILSYRANRIYQQLSAEQQGILNEYLDQHQQYQLLLEVSQIAQYALHNKLTQKEIDFYTRRIAESIQSVAESKSRATANYANARATNAQTDFFEETQPLVKAGMTQDNLIKYQTRRQLEYTVGSIIKRTIAENGFYSSFFGNEQMAQDWKNSFFGSSFQGRNFFGLVRHFATDLPSVSGGVSVLGTGFNVGIK